MEYETERLLKNLGVLSVLSDNDKLLTKDDLFQVYQPTTTRAIFRFYYGECRKTNIQHVQSCIRDAKTFITQSLNSLSDVQDSSNDSILKRINHSTQQQLCRRMLTALKDSMKGLSCLSITYKDDPSCLTSLNLLLAEINDFIQTTELLLQSSPILQRFNVNE